MITKAAVVIYDNRQEKTITIPCHRHCDAFYILKEMGYKKGKDYEEIAQGFLDEKDHFYPRNVAKKIAQDCGQIKDTEYNELYSEDLW